MDIYDLGAIVRKTRKAQRMTQADLAAAVGLSRHTIMQLESGQISDLGIRKVLAILQTLALEASFQHAESRRPTLEEMYERNAQDAADLADRHRRRRDRI